VKDPPRKIKKKNLKKGEKYLPFPYPIKDWFLE
jgi:hypothetical protein